MTRSPIKETPDLTSFRGKPSTRARLGVQGPVKGWGGV